MGGSSGRRLAQRLSPKRKWVWRGVSSGTLPQRGGVCARGTLDLKSWDRVLPATVIQPLFGPSGRSGHGVGLSRPGAEKRSRGEWRGPWS